MKLPRTPAEDDLRFLTETLNTREIEIEALNADNEELRKQLKAKNGSKD